MRFGNTIVGDYLVNWDLLYNILHTFWLYKGYNDFGEEKSNNSYFEVKYYTTDFNKAKKRATIQADDLITRLKLSPPDNIDEIKHYFLQCAQQAQVEKEEYWRKVGRTSESNIRKMNAHIKVGEGAVKVLTITRDASFSTVLALNGGLVAASTISLAGGLSVVSGISVAKGIAAYLETEGHEDTRVGKAVLKTYSSLILDSLELVLPPAAGAQLFIQKGLVVGLTYTFNKADELLSPEQSGQGALMVTLTGEIGKLLGGMVAEEYINAIPLPSLYEDVVNDTATRAFTRSFTEVAMNHTIEEMNHLSKIKSPYDEHYSLPVSKAGAVTRLLEESIYRLN